LQAHVVVAEGVDDDQHREGPGLCRPLAPGGSDRPQDDDHAEPGKDPETHPVDDRCP
jgi:hypothetical protein